MAGLRLQLQPPQCVRPALASPSSREASPRSVPARGRPLLSPAQHTRKVKPTHLAAQTAQTRHPTPRPTTDARR